jgi:hypothetical protein
MVVDLKKMPSGLNRNVESVDDRPGSTTRCTTCEPSAFAGSTTAVPSGGTFEVLLATVVFPVCLNRYFPGAAGAGPPLAVGVVGEAVEPPTRVVVVAPAPPPAPPEVVVVDATAGCIEVVAASEVVVARRAVEVFLLLPPHDAATTASSTTTTRKDERRISGVCPLTRT